MAASRWCPPRPAPASRCGRDAGRPRAESGEAGLVSYIAAGYAAALSVLFAYGVVLTTRRRRLERAVSSAGEDSGAQTRAAAR